MTTIVDLVDSNAMFKFFCDAMMHGYIGGLNPVVNVPLQGWATCTYQDGVFVLTDSWYTHLGVMTGETRIFYQGLLVWTMSYWGLYPSHVESFLKRALAGCYGNLVFCGCRGPKRFSEDGLLYTNAYAGPFTNFVGDEQITDKSGELVGRHRYKGGTLSGM